MIKQTADREVPALLCSEAVATKWSVGDEEGVWDPLQDPRARLTGRL